MENVIELTEQKAIQESIRLWEFLKENIDDEVDKCDYDNYEEIKNYLSLCPLCQYYKIQHNGSCEKCPLKNCGVHKFVGFQTDYDLWCNYVDDPYGSEFTTTDVINAIDRMLDAMKDRLDELMPLTEERALIESIELWEFLENGIKLGKKKSDYPKYNDISEYRSDCPLCEYYKKDRGGCEKCPLESCSVEAKYFTNFQFWVKYIDVCGRNKIRFGSIIPEYSRERIDFYSFQRDTQFSVESMLDAMKQRLKEITCKQDFTETRQLKDCDNEKIYIFVEGEKYYKLHYVDATVQAESLYSWLSLDNTKECYYNTNQKKFIAQLKYALTTGKLYEFDDIKDMADWLFLQVNKN